MGVSQDIDTLAVETFDKNAHVLMGVSNETQFEVSASGENMFTDNALLFFILGVAATVAVIYFVRRSKDELLESVKKEIAQPSNSKVQEETPTPILVPVNTPVPKPKFSPLKAEQAVLPLQKKNSNDKAAKVKNRPTMESKQTPTPAPPGMTNYFSQSTFKYREKMRKLINSYSELSGKTPKEIRAEVRVQMSVYRIDNMTCGEVDDACKWLRLQITNERKKGKE